MSVVALKRKVKDDVEPEIDINTLLDKASVPVEAGKSSKSSVPMITVSKEIQELASKVRRYKEEMDSAESMYEEKAEELRLAITPLRDSLCRVNFTSSVKFFDSQKKAVSLSWSNKYSTPDFSNASGIMELVGEKFKTFFEQLMTITVRNVSETGLQELVKLVGPENFARLFEVKRTLKATEAFHTTQFTLSEGIRSKLSAWFKQNRPSVKV
jgi:hypothetical protein